MFTTKKVLNYVGATNNKHAYFLDRDEVTPFESTQFVDVPYQDWKDMDYPHKITVTIEPGDTTNG